VSQKSIAQPVFIVDVKCFRIQFRKHPAAKDLFLLVRSETRIEVLCFSGLLQ